MTHNALYTPLHYTARSRSTILHESACIIILLQICMSDSRIYINMYLVMKVYELPNHSEGIDTRMFNSSPNCPVHIVQDLRRGTSIAKCWNTFDDCFTYK
jgi:hypothetical protein